MRRCLGWWMKWAPTAAVAGLCMAWGGAEGMAQVTGQWDFDQGNLTATVGRDLGYFDGAGGSTELATQFGLSSEFGLPDMNGQAVRVMRIPKNTAAMGLVLYPDMEANGGGVLVNQYSLVFDLLFPTESSGQSRSLLQSDDPFINLTNAGLLVNTANAVGVDGTFHGVLVPNQWHRLVVTVDLAAQPPVMTKYIDGLWVGQQVLSQGVDGRWALNDKAFGFGSDAALLFTGANGASEVTYLSSLQVHNSVLSAPYVAALGGPVADKIPAMVTPRALVGRILPEPGELAVLPGTLLEVEILEGSEPVSLETLEWVLNGQPIVPTATRPSAGVLKLSHDAGLLPPASVQTQSLRFVDPSVGEVIETGEWSFTVAPYNLPPMDPAFESMLYLSFDETDALQGGSVMDGSSEGNHGTLRLQVESGDHKIAGVIGQALDFKADQFNYVELSKAWSGLPNTFSVWVRVSPEVPDGTRVGVILGTFNAANNINWEMHTQGRARIYWNNGNPDWNVSGFDLRTGEWEHVAFVRNPQADTLTLYWNGRRVAQRTAVGADVIPTVPSFVGADRRGESSPYFRGALDELVVYERPLTDVEIWRLYARALDLPTYLFPTPQVTEVLPVDGAMREGRLPAVQVMIDEENSSTKVDRSTLTLTLNGVGAPVDLSDEGGFLLVRHQVGQPFGPGTLVTAILQYETTGATPETVSKTWSFAIAPLPTITAEPEDRQVLEGAAVSMQVSVLATAPVSYQWRHDGEEIENATSAMLRLEAVTEDDAGLYDVVVTDLVGEVISRSARLVVLEGLPEDPAESLRIGLNAHWPFDGDFSSPVFGLDATPRNNPVLSTEARIGTGSVQFVQDLQQSVGVSRPVIANNSLTYSSAGWFRITGGTGRRFLWETAPSNWAISTEITAANTLRVFTRNANLVQRDVDTLIEPAWNEWHHVAVVFDAVLGEAAIYFNGQRVDLPFPLEQSVGTADSTGFNIGTYRAADGRFFDGYLDDVAVWERPLKASEIAWLAAGNGVPAPLNAPLDPIVITQPPMDAAGWIGSTVFLSVTATGSEPLTYQWRKNGEAIEDATTSRLALGLTSPEIAGEYTVVVRDAEKFKESSVAQVEIWMLPDDVEASLLSGLSASWSFDEDTSSSVPGFDGVPFGGAEITEDARVGTGSVVFSQSGAQYVDVDAQVIPDGTLTYSVAGWFRSAGGSGRRFLWETSPSNWAISAEISAAGNLQVFTRQSVLNSLSINTLIAPQPGDWHHLAVVFNAVIGEVWVFVDGVRVEVPFPIVVGAGTAPTTGFHMGTYRAADGRFFEGQLDEVGVWSRLLTEGEILHLAAGNPIVGGDGDEGIRITHVEWTGQGVVLSWNGSGGALYQVQHRERLGIGSWINLGEPTMEDDFTDVTPMDATRFYRVIRIE